MEIFTPPQVKEKRPTGRQPTHSVEYMIMVARKVCEEGMSYREAAKTFNISHGTVHAWILKYKHQGHKIKRNIQNAKHKREVENFRHESQVRELKNEIAELYLENLMLKKALKHSLQLKKSDSSVITSENLDQLPEVAE